jgi:hypothetical protein
MNALPNRAVAASQRCTILAKLDHPVTPRLAAAIKSGGPLPDLISG